MSDARTANLDFSIDGTELFVIDEASGLLIMMTAITGWYGGAGVQTNFTQRSNAHGAYDAPVYRTPRVIQPSGFAYADNRDTLMAALRDMVGTLAEGGLGQMIGVDPSYGTLSCMVRISDEPQLSWDQIENSWNWQLQFTAPDPRLYAALVSATVGLPSGSGSGMEFPLFDVTGKIEFGTPGSVGALTLSNPGNGDATITFTINGPVIGGFVLTDVASGRRIVYSDDVPDSSTLLVIDSATGRATLNGADRTGEITVNQWWPVKAGASSTIQFATLGVSGQTGTLTAALNPVYW